MDFFHNLRARSDYLGKQSLQNLPCSIIVLYNTLKNRDFPFQNSPKSLDPSYKTDLEFWDCLGNVKLTL